MRYRNGARKDGCGGVSRREHIALVMAVNVNRLRPSERAREAVAGHTAAVSRWWASDDPIVDEDSLIAVCASYAIYCVLFCYSHAVVRIYYSTGLCSYCGLLVMYLTVPGLDVH